MSLCPSCLAESDAWLAYRPRVLGLTIHEKATRDTTRAGVRDRTAARAAGWRDLVRAQRSLIAANCIRSHVEARERERAATEGTVDD